MKASYETSTKAKKHRGKHLTRVLKRLANKSTRRLSRRVLAVLPDQS